MAFFIWGPRVLSGSGLVGEAQGGVVSAPAVIKKELQFGPRTDWFGGYVFCFLGALLMEKNLS